ncbi:2-amino-4-hydroxy-6-hydroxymethyldihydropteridine diphosphokinase [Trueperella pyogenes]|uniref:2-amino-4-hydroxy-6- hydroxymethyldihydropteridine diphosphokinase n=1 Tax=Trueperella pyogenes TaxID=1661 RepID=UPI00345D8087
MNYGKIELTGLRARGTHGVLDFEHSQAQDFVVDVTLFLDITRATATDNIDDTISYAEVANVARSIIEGEHADLIETLAHRIATRVKALGAEGVAVTVHKPQAPIPHEFADVAVTIEEWDTDAIAVVSIGANLDDPARHVRAAISQIGEITEVVAASQLYRTAPRLAEGQEGQPDYVNAVVIVETGLNPHELLEKLQAIEAGHGRVRDERWGPRTLDLDIITYSDLTLDDPDLTLPHPRAAGRRFVLEPWFSIDPDAELAGHDIRSLLAKLGDQRVELYED